MLKPHLEDISVSIRRIPSNFEALSSRLVDLHSSIPELSTEALKPQLEELSAKMRDLSSSVADLSSSLLALELQEGGKSRSWALGLLGSKSKRKLEYTKTSTQRD